MKYEPKTNNNVVYICHYHVVFCPKYRRKVLVPPIDERLKVIILETVEKWGQTLIEMEVMPDHVHLLLGCDPQFGIHRLVVESEIGIDLGVTHFAALSDGTFIESPRYYRTSQKKREKLQQSLSRKKRGSHRRKKTVK